jgi:hypothetical protein
VCVCVRARRLNLDVYVFFFTFFFLRVVVMWLVSRLLKKAGYKDLSSHRLLSYRYYYIGKNKRKNYNRICGQKERLCYMDIIFLYTCIHTYIHKPYHFSVYALHTYLYIHTYIDIHTYIYIHICIYIHTYIHT